MGAGAAIGLLVTHLFLAGRSDQAIGLAVLGTLALFYVCIDHDIKQGMLYDEEGARHTDQDWR